MSPAEGTVGAAAVDELYGLPLEEFTSRRDALAKDLKRGGDAAGAAEVKGLRKPNRTAWALNQLARRQPADVERLLAVGEELRRAQQRALAGDATALRAAGRAEQDHIDRLVDAALALAPPAAEERIRKTLRAAATDPEVGARLRRGCLVADVETSGFGLDGVAEIGAGPAPSRAAGGAGNEAREPAGRAAEHAPDAGEQAGREARRAAMREADRLRAEAEAASSEARRLADQAEAAEDRARHARRQAVTAAQRAEELQSRAAEAAGRAQALRRP